MITAGSVFSEVMVLNPYAGPYWFHEYQIKKTLPNFIDIMSEYMPGISHLCLPCFFCPEVVAFPSSPILQSVVSSVSPLSDQLRPIVVVVVVVDILVFDVTVETISDAIETWTYQELEAVEWLRFVLQFLFSCKHTWYDKILNFV